MEPAAVAAHADTGPTPTEPWPPDGAVRIVTLRSGAIHETARSGASCHGLLADEEARTWVDLTDPHPAAVESVGAAHRAAPAGRRGHHRQQ